MLRRQRPVGVAAQVFGLCLLFTAWPCAAAALPPVPSVPWQMASAPAAEAAAKLVRIAASNPSLAPQQSKTAPTAQMWLGQSPAGLQIHVRVADEAHCNDAAAEQLALGDAVQLQMRLRDADSAADDRALGAWAAGAEYSGPQDFVVTLALARGQPLARWQLHNGSAAPDAALPAPYIVHDAQTKQTDYDVVLPWACLRRTPGSATELRLGAVVHQSDGPQAPLRHLRLGVGAAGGFRPQTLQAIALQPDPALDKTQPAKADVSDACGALCAQQRRTFASAQARLGIWQRHADAPLLQAHVATLQALLYDRMAQQMLGSAAERAGAAAETDLLARGILGVPRAADGRDTLWAEQIHQGLRPALFAVRSASDAALVPAALFVPKQHQPQGRAAPMVVFLHGRGDARLGDFAADLLQQRQDALDDTYVLIPWTRGNLGAQELGLGDVLALVDTAVQRHAIDAAQVALLGFSLGGSGAFHLAIRAPERFSAVAIASGGAWLVPLGLGLGSNARELPVFLWHGDKDDIVDVKNQDAIVRELAAAGVSYQAVRARGIGHQLSAQLKARMLAFVAGKKRCGPQTHYISDGPLHRGTDAIKLAYDARLARTPSWQWQRRGQTLQLYSQGTNGLEVDLSRLGFAAEQSVEVLWNGRCVYQGLPQAIAVGEGASRP